MGGGPPEVLSLPGRDQLAPLYAAGLHNLWQDLVAQAPASAYSYVFDGQAQTLDHLFVNDPLYGDLVQMRAAHVNADWAADHEGNGSKGSSDHDPQVARFRSRAALSIADAGVAEGDRGATTLAFPVTLSRPLSHRIKVCATAVGRTAWPVLDFAPLLTCRSIPAGATTATISVAVRGDTRRERDESFRLLVTGPAHLRPAAATAVGTIVNDD